MQHLPDLRHLTAPIVLAALLAGAASILGCQRPFVEPPEPLLEIVAPDFSNVIAADSIEVVVRADAFRAVESVTVDDLPLAFDQDEQVWTRRIGLGGGLNRLVFAVTDSDDRIVRDTAYAFHANLRVTRDRPPLPEPRGGHSATILHDGSLLVLGGVRRLQNADARADGVILAAAGFQFTPIAAPLRHGRVGHTATLLPDGRVLIAGGSRSFVIDDIDDLIEPVEIFDPESGRFELVPLSGPPIRRAHHTAVLRVDDGDLLLDLYGGTGDIRYSPEAVLGTRGDVRTFLFRNDSLFAASPAPGPRLDVTFTGHTLTPLRSGRAGKMLLAGLVGLPSGTENFAATIDYDEPGGLIPLPTGSPQTPRMHHAAHMLAPGRVLLAGGHQGDAASAVSDPEIFAEEASEFFRFAGSIGVQRRFGLTATKLADGRILFLGGFAPSGEGVAIAESFQIATR